jgi:hypothetical protein
MSMSVALTIVLALGAGAGDDRLLLCRPQVQGDPAQARAEAVVQAAGKLGGRFLDYGAECRDAGEGARAARRAGLDHAVVSTAEGTAERARFELVLADADGDAVRTRRTLDVKPSEDAVPPIKGALKELLKTLPPKPGPDPQHVAAWSVAGAGLAAVVAGVVLSVQAGEAERSADRATDPATYQRERQRAREKRHLGNLALGVGGAGVAAGLTWRFAF